MNNKNENKPRLIDKIKKFFDFKSVNIRAALITAIPSIIIAIISSAILFISSCNNNKLATAANSLSDKANQTASKSFEIANEIYKSKEIPRLIAAPLAPKFYVPENPEVSGQVKINLSAIIENLSEVSAREVAINFETEDWCGHKTSLFDIYKEAKCPIPHLLSLPKNSRLEYPSYYRPDAPASGENGFVTQDKPFRLKLTLYWKDINDKKYVYIGFYELKNAVLPDNENQLYFQPVNTYDNVKDGDIAWDYADKKF